LQIYKEVSVFELKRSRSAPLNLFKGDVIETLQHFLLHLTKGPCTARNTVPKLCCTPVLLNKVEFAMILRIEVAQMTMRLDILLEQGLLRYEIELCVKNMPTAASGLSLTCGTLGARAFDREASLGPKSALADDLFHALEPPWIRGVIIWKIKRLPHSRQGIDAIAHAWPLWVVHPEALGILGDIDKKK
jgi:hypothetical protein